MTISRTRARSITVGAALLTGAAVVLAAPLAASAHVRVDPVSATPGAYATLTFKVPNESATAETTSVTLDLPQDTPFTSVSYQPVPGWSAVVTTATLPSPVTVGDATITEAPVSVTWTADPGTGIADGEYQQFPISAGPVPDTENVLLPVHQGYSDGTVVDWDEPTPASGEEPEHPAPTLYIGESAPEAGHAHGGGSSADADADAAADAGAASGATSGASDGAAMSVISDGATSDGAATASAAESTAFTALGIGIGGFVVGAAGLAVAAVALLRRPRAAAATKPESVR